MSSQTIQGWNCAHCTYYHYAAANRCVMCNEPRVSKAQMADFITKGKKPPRIQQPPQQQNRATKQATLNLSVKQPNSQSSSSSSNKNNSSNTTTATTNAVVNPYSNKRKSSQISSFFVPPTAQQATAAHPSSQVVAHNSAAAAATTTDAKPAVLNDTVAQSESKKQKKSASISDKAINKSHATPKKDKKTTAAAITTSERKRMRPSTSSYMDLEPKIDTPRIVPPFRPGPVPFDPVTINEWVYPVSDEYPIRQYQLEIAQVALFHNTLVSLPTGLGKTLIAAVVLYNFHMWFPTGKVLFLAPTLPLVHQQMHACTKVVGIKPEDTAILTGQTPAAQRAKIWSERRVIYATPQTVQRDLESGRVDKPHEIVCIVMDEAHKATGAYAYTQVVDFIYNYNGTNKTNGTDSTKDVEKNGTASQSSQNEAEIVINGSNLNDNDNNEGVVADTKPKVRIVGLSATPGTSIKAIQHVIDTLRIARIEARTEDDPSVEPYINKRHSEIVVVPQASACKEIEKHLSNIIGPILDRLRDSNQLNRVSGNSTVTVYSIIMARARFQNGPGARHSPQLFTYFAAAHVLVQIRADLNRHGIGVVRTKLTRLMHERQKGILASIVNSDEFRRMYDLVVKHTFDENTAQKKSFSAQDKLANNPKLTKLVELLVEHFERDRACQKSSRAIVFSQFRDSVSEIVDVLAGSAPLIRPRHFIGQGNGASATNKGKAGKSKKKKGDVIDLQASAATAETGLKGMRQAEQHQVIREFRENMYNVLVCTCIGEEGLDIGEVDLIINFDTLRSPIRMIQRVGRTGRKREGRVVCLVSEGPEEKTFKDSKYAEKYLGEALRNPKSFKVYPSEELFQVKPQRSDRNLLAAIDNYHMSQVQGNVKNKKKAASAGQTSEKNNKSWMLTDDEENKRKLLFGPLPDVPIMQTSNLRRHFLTARNMALSSKERNKRAGRTAALLASFVSNHGEENEARSMLSSSTSIKRRYRHARNEYEIIFALDSTTYDYTKEQNETKTKQKPVNIQLARNDKPTSSATPPLSVTDTVGNATHVAPSTLQSSEPQSVETNTSSMHATNVTNTRTPAITSVTPASNDATTSSTATIRVDRTNTIEDRDVFVLPPPEDDSSSSSEDDEASGNDKNDARLVTSDDKNDSVVEQSFCLPTQESSSDDDSTRASIDWEKDDTQSITGDNEKRQFKRLRKINAPVAVSAPAAAVATTITTSAATVSTKTDASRQQRDHEVMNKLVGKRRHVKESQRRRHYSHFLQEEAEVDSDTDVDGDSEDESEVRAIEEEEALAEMDFINDSSQLGYSPCSIDAVDPDNNNNNKSHHDADNDDLHRHLDKKRADDELYNTPTFNRRMHIQSQPTSAPDSASGLGKMHFIRSVLEHHRNGGDVEDIEAFMNEEGVSSDIDEEALRPVRPPVHKQVLQFFGSDCESD